jgi:hypothetical protein
MEKFVFYETDKSVWFCPSRDWNKFTYDNEICPIREATTLATQEGIAELFKIYESDIDLFVELIRQELAENFLTVYTN